MVNSLDKNDGHWGAYMALSVLYTVAKNQLWSDDAASPVVSEPVASSVVGSILDQLSWKVKLAVGVVGILGGAYLVNRYWKGSGVHVTNNNNVNIHLSVNGLPVGHQTRVIQKDREVTVLIEPSRKEKFRTLVHQVLGQLHAA